MTLLFSYPALASPQPSPDGRSAASRCKVGRMKRSAAGSVAESAGPSPTPFVRRAVLWLVWAERVVFFLIGVLLFLAAVALLKESAVVLLKMYVGGGLPATAYGSQFLDVVLLVLMIVELAYNRDSLAARIRAARRTVSDRRTHRRHPAHARHYRR